MVEVYCNSPFLCSSHLPFFVPIFCVINLNIFVHFTLCPLLYIHVCSQRFFNIIKSRITYGSGTSLVQTQMHRTVKNKITEIYSATHMYVKLVVITLYTDSIHVYTAMKNRN